jgi:broad specificity polyphosphatase/5'/3'-nucleotidase SurE
MKILVSNDDGYRSFGLLALVAASESIAEVVVVAP